MQSVSCERGEKRKFQLLAVSHTTILLLTSSPFLLTAPTFFWSLLKAAPKRRGCKGVVLLRCPQQRLLVPPGLAGHQHCPAPKPTPRGRGNLFGGSHPPGDVSIAARLHPWRVSWPHRYLFPRLKLGKNIPRVWQPGSAPVNPSCQHENALAGAGAVSSRGSSSQGHCQWWKVKFCESGAREGRTRTPSRGYVVKGHKVLWYQRERRRKGDGVH